MTKDQTSIFDLQAELCKAMSNAIRLEIVHLLRDEPKCVRDLAQLIGCPPGTISRHLTTLRNVGVINGQRQGQEIYYQITNPKIVSVCDLMRQILAEQTHHRSEMMKAMENDTTE
jgi:DNA-binding transcriptional ArsR family regulator